MTLPPQSTPGDLQGGTQSNGATGSAPLGDSARDLANEAKREGAVKVDALRSSTSHKVDALAEGARAAAGALKQDDVAQMSAYLEQFAGGLQRLSGTIRDKSGEELLQELNRLARENPTMFMTACVAVGFGLGRFAKATRPEERAAKQAGTSADAGAAGTASPAAAGVQPAPTPVASGPATSTGTPLGATSVGTAGTSEFSGSGVGPGASSVGEGAGTAGSRLAGGSATAGSGTGPESWRSRTDAGSGTGGTNITNDEAGGLSS